MHSSSKTDKDNREQSDTHAFDDLANFGQFAPMPNSKMFICFEYTTERTRENCCVRASLSQNSVSDIACK